MTNDQREAMDLLSPHLNRRATVLVTHNRAGLDANLRRKAVGAVTRATLLNLQARGLLEVEIFREHADVTVIRRTLPSGRPIFGRRPS